MLQPLPATVGFTTNSLLAPLITGSMLGSFTVFKYHPQHGPESYRLQWFGRPVPGKLNRHCASHLQPTSPVPNSDDVCRLPCEGQVLRLHCRQACKLVRCLLRTFMGWLAAGCSAVLGLRPGRVAVVHCASESLGISTNLLWRQESWQHSGL